MNRNKTAVRSTLVASSAFIAALLTTPNLLMAQDARVPDTKSNDAPAQGLPLRHIALFSSGVGYFSRAGKVNGDGEVELYFQRDDLNDVLKSLVITDPSGELRPATYSIDELLARRPQQNMLPLPDGATLGGILRGFQGALIEIESGGKKVRGRLISVGTKSIRDKNGEVTTTDVASIHTDNGLASVRLDAVEDGGLVRLLDAKLNRKLSEQLETSAIRLTSSVDAGYRPVRLRFAGKGARDVKAGYIQATSVWKTSYRLVFDSPKNTRAGADKKAGANVNDARPLLQGWAIVENTTDEDWTNVGLSLIAGRPVSFAMNMAAPLYVQRPEVALPFAGAPRSQVYEEATAKSPRISTSRPMVAGPQGPGGQPDLSKRAAGIFTNAGDFDGKVGVAREEALVAAEQMMQQQASAATSEKGELFEYAIRQPVSLNRGEAAMVPIVSEAITGEKLTIIDARQGALYPVHGMRLHNSTGLHLAGGPITIYQDGLYAGDAQITNIAPGDHRLVSYALDLDLIAAREEPTFVADTTGLAAKAGVLTITRKQRQTQVFTLRNKSQNAKTVLIQMPIDTNFKLVEPKEPSEKSANEYRFEVAVPAGKTTEFKVAGERIVSETVAILSSDIDTLAAYARHTQVSPALKAALTGVVTRRNKLKELQGRRVWTETQINEISEEQGRIRANMNSIARDSDLYKRYLEKLTTQETQIEKLREELARLRDAETEANKELSTYVQGLSFEK